MRNGDCNVKVYWAWSTTVATPIPAAERRRRAKSLAGICCGFERLPRARLGAVEFRGTGWRLWIAGTLGQGCLVLVVEWIAKGKGVAEAFLDQITTTARQRSAANPRGRSSGRKPPGVPVASRFRDSRFTLNAFHREERSIAPTMENVCDNGSSGKRGFVCHL